MSLHHKIFNLIGVLLPLAGVVTAVVLLWNKAIGPLELGLLVGLYVITCLGVTLGYHRMFTHRRVRVLARVHEAVDRDHSARWPSRAR